MNMVACIGLAKSLKMLRNYDQALVFAKKALEYSWVTRNEGKEFFIYEFIGIIHFLNQNVQYS